MNKLFASVCWLMFGELFIPLFDIVRYLTRPFPTSICFVHLLIKVIGNSMFLLYFDAILIAKYFLICRLKNPGHNVYKKLFHCHCQ